MTAPQEADRTKLMTALRESSDQLATLRAPVLFPGWDTSRPSTRAEAIRAAARGILGQDDPDTGVRLTGEQLSALVRYIADMLEE